MNYIAMDCHISTLEFAVVNESGRITQEKRVNTGVKELIEFVKSVPKPRKIIMEEGTLASWVLEMCTDFGEELIITDPKTNRWIGQSGQKNDAFDARRLGQLARGGYIKEIQGNAGNRTHSCCNNISHPGNTEPICKQEEGVDVCRIRDYGEVFRW